MNEKKKPVPRQSSEHNVSHDNRKFRMKEKGVFDLFEKELVSALIVSATRQQVLHSK